MFRKKQFVRLGVSLYINRDSILECIPHFTLDHDEDQPGVWINCPTQRIFMNRGSIDFIDDKELRTVAEYLFELSIKYIEDRHDAS